MYAGPGRRATRLVRPFRREPCVETISRGGCAPQDRTARSPRPLVLPGMLASSWGRLSAMPETVEIGLGRSARRGYHLDDIALVPVRRTRGQAAVSTAWQIDAHA